MVFFGELSLSEICIGSISYTLVHVLFANIQVRDCNVSL